MFHRNIAEVQVMDNMKCVCGHPWHYGQCGECGCQEALADAAHYSLSHAVERRMATKRPYKRRR